MAGLLRRFPPRPARWQLAADQPAADGQVLARLFAPPFPAGRDRPAVRRRIGLTQVVHWLEQQPG